MANRHENSGEKGGLYGNDANLFEAAGIPSDKTFAARAGSRWALRWKPVKATRPIIHYRTTIYRTITYADPTSTWTTFEARSPK